MPSRTKSPSAEDNVRQIEIYHRAAQIFHEKGFDATSMSDIAEAVNLTKAGLYYYIDSKEDLLFAIMEYAMSMLQEQVIDPAKGTADPEERLSLILQNHARLVMGNNKTITILTDEMAGLNPKHHKLIISRKRDYFDLVRSTLEELIALKKIKPLNTTVMAYSIFGMLLWLPRWYNPQGNLTCDDVILNLKSLLYGGIGETPAALEFALRNGHA
ncbi:MAG: TetR/AcrR family transcriptional regulator [Planctomycetales bacterium]